VTVTEPLQRGRALSGLLRAAWKEYEHDYARYFAVAMIYYALVSLVPLLLLLLGTLGWLLRWSGAVSAAKQQVLATVQTSFGEELRTTIEQLLRGLEQQSVVAAIVSLVGLVLSASLIIKHLRMGFRAIWKHAPPMVSGPLLVGVRKSFVEKAIAFGMLMTGALLLLAAFALVAVVNRVSDSFGPGWLAAIPSSLIIVPLTFALLFTYLPPVRLPWRHVWFATMLCASAWLIGVELLALYGSFFGKNFSTYGAVGGVLVIMLWINVVSQVLFFGAEVCKVTYWWSSGVTPAQGVDTRPDIGARVRANHALPTQRP
jgi:membrane protein